MFSCSQTTGSRERLQWQGSSSPRLGFRVLQHLNNVLCHCGLTRRMMTTPPNYLEKRKILMHTLTFLDKKI